MWTGCHAKIEGLYLSLLKKALLQVKAYGGIGDRTFCRQITRNLMATTGYNL